ncbi:MAG: NAD(P)-binding protein [Candidatus Aenigmatarchaeota archaeon]
MANPVHKKKGKARSFSPSLNFLMVVGVTVIATISMFLLVIVGKTSTEDAVYWTLCSITSASCFVSEKFYAIPVVRVFALINGSIFILIISFLAASIVERMGRVDLKEKSVRKRLEELSDHFIICGHGRVGEKISSVMRTRGISFVTVDKDPETIKELNELGGLTVEGNALDSRVLERAGIRKAKGLIAGLNTDSDNISLVLTANDINPNLLIGARADSEAAIRRLHRAGAEIVVLPEVVGGLQLAKEILELEDMESHDMVSRKSNNP